MKKATSIIALTVSILFSQVICISSCTALSAPLLSPAVSVLEQALNLYHGGHFFEALELWSGITGDENVHKLADDARKRMSLAPVKVDGKWGYIDQFDHLVLPFRYEDAKLFSGGQALVCMDGQWMLIDPVGAIIKDLKADWLEVGPFNDGLAYYSKLDEGGFTVYGCIDLRGNVIFKAFSRIPIYFINGVAMVKYGLDYYYMDLYGNLFEKVDLRLSRNTSNVGHEKDLYSMEENYVLHKAHGKCSTSGTVIYQEASVPSERIKRYGYIFEDGTIAIPPRFLHAGPFIDGLAPVCDTSGKWGFIDRYGDYAISPIYEHARRFSQGLAPVKLNGLYGYINTRGEMVIQPQFYDAGIFREGLAGVKVIHTEFFKGWGFIDQGGQLVIPAAFGDIGEDGFMGGYCVASSAEERVSLGSGIKYGVIDTKGKWKIKPKYEFEPSAWPRFIFDSRKYTSLGPKYQVAQYDAGLNNHGEIEGRYWNLSNNKTQRFVFSDEGYVDAMKDCDIAADDPHKRPTHVWTLLTEAKADLEYVLGESRQECILYKQDSAYGFLDRKGNVVIKAKYEAAGHFGGCTDELLPPLAAKDINLSVTAAQEGYIMKYPKGSADYEHMDILVGKYEGREIMLIGRLNISSPEDGISSIFFYDFFSELLVFSGSGRKDTPPNWAVETSFLLPGDLRIESYTPFKTYYKKVLPKNKLQAEECYNKTEMQRLFEELVPLEKRLFFSYRQTGDLYVARYHERSMDRDIMLFTVKGKDDELWYDAVSGFPIKDEYAGGISFSSANVKRVPFEEYFANVPHKALMSVGKLQALYEAYIPFECQCGLIRE